MKTCYYELLDVEVHASDIELKKAFRKKALQYHPDKNPDNVEEATAIFASIRSAYEVLSDPQERAWYDAHKQQILNDEPLFDDNGEGTSYEVDPLISGVTIEELMMFFNTSLYTRFDDSPAGIYQIAGKVFARIAKDEVLNGRKLNMTKYYSYHDDLFDTDIVKLGYSEACKKHQAMYNSNSSHLCLPIFGSTSMDYESLKNFYKKWGGFSTLKSFSWKDEYMYSDTYDRRTKREVNKRNEKTRKAARNEYNKTVNRFVTFIKKLDKRMKEGVRIAEEERRARTQMKKQKSKASLGSKIDKLDFELQSWQEVDENNWDELEDAYEKWNSNDNSESQSNEYVGTDKNEVKLNEDEILVYECVLCQKIFKSDKQLENHTKTKLHSKNVNEMYKKMKKDGFRIGLDSLSDADDFDSLSNSEAEDEPATEAKQMNMSQLNQELEELEKQLADLENVADDNDDISIDEIISVEIEVSDVSENDQDLEQTKNKESKDEISSEEEEKILPNNDLERDNELNALLNSLQNDGNANNDSDDDWSKKKKSQSKQKRKTKQSTPKVSQQYKGNTPILTELCGSCGDGFTSRNALFKHIKKTGHAAPPAKLKKRGKT